MGMSACYGGGSDDATTAIGIGVVALALSVVALILGIKAIGNFKKGRALGRKPIGTLIVGIGGTVMAGFGLLFTFLGFMMAAVCL